MSAEDYFNENETNEDVTTGYISPEDLIASLKDKPFGPRARRVAQGIVRMTARLQKAMEEDERFGNEPPVGSCIAVTKTHSGKVFRDHEEPAGSYTYVWFRSPVGWHATGRSVKIWAYDDIAAFIGRDEARVSHIDEWEVR